MRLKNTWQEIRDHSFIQNHSRSSDSQIHDGASSLQFTHVLQGSDQRTPDKRSETIPSSRITPDPSDSQLHDGASSVHLTHVLQGSDQRTPDKRSEIIPSSRITPDPSDSQIHDGASSVHSCSTGFRSENWNGSRSLVLRSVTRFCVVFEVCVWIIIWLEDPNMAHYKISNRVSHLLIFYLLVFDRIHDAMCLNKIFMTSSRNIGPQHQKYSGIFHCTHGILFNLLSNFVDRFMPKHTHYTLTNIRKEKKHNRTPLGTYICNFFPLPDKKNYDSCG